MVAKLSIRIIVPVLLVMLFMTGARAQQDQTWQPYWYPQAPGSAPLQPSINNGSVYSNPWNTDERSRQVRPGQHRPYTVPQQARPSRTPPRIEAFINEIQPYEQQSLVYIVRITSTGDLKSVSPVLPDVESVVVRQLGDPVSSREEVSGKTKFITEYRYLLMPLSAGVVEMPRAEAEGVMTYATSGGGSALQLVAKESVVLDVLPAVEAVQPWLPLEKLQIEARILDKEQLVAGDPIRLEVEMSAIGASGGQLPSLASQLKSQDFRLYPGKSFTEGKLSADGSELRGRRIETFTLVPQYGGWLKIPNLSLNWWNVGHRRPEVASFLMDRVKVAGPENPSRRGGSRSGVSNVFGDAGFLIWVPLIIAIGILVYGWVSAFVGPGRIPGSAAIIGFMRSLLGELYTPLAALGARVSPRRQFHRLRTLLGRNLPVSWKLWFCLRAVAREGDPDEWGHALQILAAKHLGVRPQAHLQELGKSIAACHPRADGRRVELLMAELNEAIYGDRPIRSFDRWKREFERQIKPGLFPIRFRNCRPRSLARRLPELNPR